MSGDYSYKVGGSLEYQHPTYVVRKADSELYEGLTNGEFCYVLNSRQMGKSSLRVQMMKKLKEQGCKCASIDMTRIGSHVTPAEWYAGVVSELLRGFGLSRKINFSSWWRDREALPPLQRLKEFVEDVLVVEIEQNFVVFLDEIDSTLKIKFKDDFFAFIRACYNQRVDNPEYNRLTFCLLGVATPSDLIADKQRTPFNIGRAIELTGFKLEEAKVSLIQGLTQKFAHPETVLEEVLSWTDGQPFLVQKLCQIVVAKAESRKPNIGQLVQKYIIDHWETQDEPEHLRTIRDRILSDERCSGRLLGLYQQILLQGEITSDDSPEQVELRLSGLVVKQQGRLRVYNRIYEAVFNLSWVENELAKLRPYSQAIAAWLASNRQDASRLLRGKALQEALEWATDKNLSVEDYTFFAASQQLAMFQMQSDLEAERRTRATLAEAKQNAERLLKEVREVVHLERSFVKALQLFETGSGEINALLVAMQAGQALQKRVREGALMQDYSSTSPLLALQVILDHIRERNQFSGHQSWVTSVSFSPTGEYLATASVDGTAKLWDLSGNQIAQFKGHQGMVTTVSFSPTGEYLATASDDDECTTILWDLSGNAIAQFKGHQGMVTSVSFSPTGEYLVTASVDGTAKLWDLSGNQIAKFKQHRHWITSVCFSPTGEYLAIASNDRTAMLWDLSGNAIVQFKGHQGIVTSVNFSPTGEYLITASEDGSAKLWNLSGNVIAQFQGHQGGISSVCFSPTGKYIATASDDCTARLWDLSGKQVAQFKGHQGIVTSVSFSPTGDYLATASNDGTVKLWALSKNQLAVFQGHQGEVRSVSFSPTGNYIATASDDYTARLWDLSGNWITEFKGHQDWVLCVCFSPNGKYLATASKDFTARLWDLSGNAIAQFKGHQGGVSSVCFSPTGEYLATASDDCIVRLWDLSGKLITQFAGHQDWVLCVGFSPNGKYLATASNDCQVRLWDLSKNLSKNAIAVLNGHQGGVSSVCFSPQGEYLATASNDSTARLWDLSGNQIAIFRGHQGWIWSVCFSPTGEYLATASADGTARLWNLSGNQLAEYKGHQGMITSVSFSPTGEYLATASSDRTAQLWRVEGLDELLYRGCDWLKDYLATHPEASDKLEVCQKRLSCMKC